MWECVHVAMHACRCFVASFCVCICLCVYWRSKVIIQLSLSCLKTSSIPICQCQTSLSSRHLRTAEDVSTHNTSGNDPFAMATTNKEKFHECGEEGVRRIDAERERERERERESWQEVKNAKRSGRPCALTKGSDN